MILIYRHHIRTLYHRYTSMRSHVIRYIILYIPAYCRRYHSMNTVLHLHCIIYIIEQNSTVQILYSGVQVPVLRLQKMYCTVLLLYGYSTIVIIILYLYSTCTCIVLYCIYMIIQYSTVLYLCRL